MTDCANLGEVTLSLLEILVRCVCKRPVCSEEECHIRIFEKAVFGLEETALGRTLE